MSAGQHLIDVHDHHRSELAQVRDVLRRVREGVAEVGDARDAIQQLALRRNDWTLGGLCQSFCFGLTMHHTMESGDIFGHLRSKQPDLAPVLDKLHADHLDIHEILEQLDRALVRMVAHPGEHDAVADAIDALADALLEHLAYEEAQLVGPLDRWGFY